MKLEGARKVIKGMLPDRIRMLITGLFYGWHGDYSTWDEAKRKSSGYSSPEILDKVSISTGKVRDGLAVYERDSVLYDQVHYSFSVLSGLLWVAAQKCGKLSVLDFGGSLGSSYYQNKKFVDCIPEVNWCIVEQLSIVNEGQKNFSNDRLHFYGNINDCFKSYEINVVLFSSVLQYLEDPYKLLDTFISRGIEYIIIDRTPFIGYDDRITVQKVHPAIYDASYPCWFFNKKKFISYLSKEYELIVEFDALDKANIPSEFKGFIFRKK